jgi:hypothetical protein
MTTRTYGLLAVLGSALGAWWYSRHRTGTNMQPRSDRGITIYQNTPTAPSVSAEGIF